MDKKKQQTFVHRVTQLDAYIFDREINNLLMNNISEISKYLKPGTLDKYMPEIELLLKLVIFKYSVLKSNSTFGQQFFNVQYNRQLSGKEVVLFSLLNYFIPYLKQKYDDASLKWNNDKAKKIVDKLELFIKVCQFLNLMIFLNKGIFPTLADRILRIKTVPIIQQPRSVGYMYMTRKLLWHGFMEFFMYALPLINYGYIKRKIITIFSFNKDQKVIFKRISQKDVTACSICGEAPVYPCRISLHCKHVACYYCIKSNIMEDDAYTCPSCGVKSTAHTNLQFIDFGGKK